MFIGLHELNSLSEKVYTVNDWSDEDDLDYEITTFFSKLMNRRRNDDIEEGLQAGGVILPDKAGFKICERDGKGSHAQAQENVSQYLNGERSFTGEETIGMLGGERRNNPNTWMNIPKHGFTVRIVATEESMIFVFNTYNYNVTDFQLDVIGRMFDCIKNAYDNGDIKYPYINYVAPRNKFVFNEKLDIDEQLDSLEEIIKGKKEVKKTR